MFPSFKKGSQNRVALLGLLEPNAFKMLKKNAFGFADVLPRDGQLIVNSILQHVGRRETYRSEC
jgi:hypothetical protein